MKQFATCHCHPASLDSASTPEAMIAREVELGSGVITCTDHGTLAAAQKIYSLGKKSGLIPVIGLEAYFRDDDCQHEHHHSNKSRHNKSWVDERVARLCGQLV